MEAEIIRALVLAAQVVAKALIQVGMVALVDRLLVVLKAAEVAAVLVAILEMAEMEPILLWAVAQMLALLALAVLAGEVVLVLLAECRPT